MKTSSADRWRSRLGSIVLMLVCWQAAAQVQAQGLAKPLGPIVLTVSGQITQRNSPQGAQFDAAMLQALPALSFTTRSQWHNKPVAYSGVALNELLKAVGAQGSTLHLLALDHFEARVPMSDAARYNPMIAMRADGQMLKVRTLGPVLLMYPFDQYPELHTDVYYSRCVWQLKRIVVE
ncbi:oxidoreductase [Rhodoferax sp. 4810]|nr:oxidoreductase [Rhodoferax jenense]